MSVCFKLRFGGPLFLLLLFLHLSCVQFDLSLRPQLVFLSSKCEYSIPSILLVSNSLNFKTTITPSPPQILVASLGSRPPVLDLCIVPKMQLKMVPLHDSWNEEEWSTKNRNHSLTWRFSRQLLAIGLTPRSSRLLDRTLISVCNCIFRSGSIGPSLSSSC